ncbi:hypothetical protein J3R30DRAFT_3733992 [Lentinula aciculospora]|uniref:ZZ-type domain-containing protein n=1 Tax=Lentinula aciculospora TaxID=153920 RepID=A0A9W9ABM8_9AGAR|nr:hypothetical protein J3R30DRAFT_3733992 [Lentinula aciculospora]
MSSPALLNALNQKCLIEASTEDLVILNYYSPLKSLPKNTGEYDEDEDEAGNAAPRATGIPKNIKTNTRKQSQGLGGGKKEQAQRCTYYHLREKIVQCFSLSALSFDICYKDDDGELCRILTENQLTDAIYYLQTAADEAHASSASSILSGRSFGSSKKIALSIHVEVDYDGPNLSDTSSIVSIEDRSLEDDSVTVSSRDSGRLSTRSFARNLGPSPRGSQLSGESSWDVLSSSRTTPPDSSIHSPIEDQDPFADSNDQLSPDDILERHRLEEDAASKGYQFLVSDQRGAKWLKEQKERAKRSLGVHPASSASDDSSSELEDQVGALSLQRAPTGNFYYTFDSHASQSQGPEDRGYEIDPSIDGGINGKPRPTSRHLHWVAAQQQNTAAHQPHLRTHHSDPSLDTVIPAELLGDIPVSPPRKEDLTRCSGCDRLLDDMKYGKGRDSSLPQFTYPPTAQTNIYTSALSPSFSSSSNTFVGKQSMFKRRPLPLEPSVSNSLLTLVPPIPAPKETGYELCPECVEEVGLIHAIEAINEPGSSPTANDLSSSSPGDAAAQWRRAPPRQKGQLRHVYVEKMWGYNGWADVVHTESEMETCYGCGVKTSLQHKMYKCAMCLRYLLCRACYSQVHVLHPVHTFLVLRGKPSRSLSDSDLTLVNDFDEQSNVHPGVECAHCCMEIVGARFHCAECDSVDICSNCESAGLPGNIDSSYGGHVSSHILIKIPFPLPSGKVQSVSRKARNLWTTDPANINRVEHSKAASEISSYARTVIGNGDMRTSEEDHGIQCDACRKPISGVRYQCANCPAPQSGYNLCSSCEEASYTVHNPMHAFFKFPRPVDRPIRSSLTMIPELYKMPAGPSSAAYDIENPPGYLRSIIHPKVLCDCCVAEIQGAWFHCAYCGKDLCSTCESVDTRDDTHVFLVLKALVDMPSLRKLLVDTENPEPVINYEVYIPN